MSFFLLPKRLCQSLASVVAKFWWSSKANSKGMHWVAWKKLCLSKKNGGICFKSFEEFNQVLLAKKLWRLNQYPNVLVSRVLKGRYLRHEHPFHAKKSLSTILWMEKYRPPTSVLTEVDPLLRVSDLIDF